MKLLLSSKHVGFHHYSQNLYELLKIHKGNIPYNWSCQTSNCHENFLFLLTFLTIESILHHHMVSLYAIIS